MPDPGRGERLNIGILLWAADRYHLRLDDDAVDRVVRENPQLVRDSLLYVAPMIRERLQEGDGDMSDRIAGLLAQQHGFPVDLSEARFTKLESATALEDAVDALVERIVHPRRRGRPSSGFDPRKAVEQRLRPLVSRGSVERHHFFKTSGTGVGRAVDFFANHGANAALDVVRLAITKASDIQSRADAEAFKVHDIQKQNDIDFIVYCDFSFDQELKGANADARKVIESTGATVVTEPDEAAAALARRANGHSG